MIGRREKVIFKTGFKMSGYAEGEHTGPVNVPVPQHDMCVTPYHKVVSHSG